MTIIRTITALIFTCLAFTVQADDEKLESLRANLKQRIPGMAIESIAPAPLPGLYEVIADGQIYYVNESATHLVQGSIIDLENRNNLTEQRLGGVHLNLIESIGEEDMLIYEPDESTDRSITVFTDTSCPYCSKLHNEIDVLLEAGVRVRYLLYPRAGINSSTFEELRSVWCADDQQAAMTAAKAGEQVAPGECDNPIEEHIAVAQQVGLRGTPLIYLDNGKRIPGYQDAAALLEQLTDTDKISLH
ncbi:MAG: DsbC family protein [Granulosicoccus sp.]